MTTHPDKSVTTPEDGMPSSKPLHILVRLSDLKEAAVLSDILWEVLRGIYKGVLLASRKAFLPWH